MLFVVHEMSGQALRRQGGGKPPPLRVLVRRRGHQAPQRLILRLLGIQHFVRVKSRGAM